MKLRNLMMLCAAMVVMIASLATNLTAADTKTTTANTKDAKKEAKKEAKEAKKEAKEAKKEAKTAKKEEARETSTTGAKIDLNTASEKDLVSLPGVGEATARKIIAGRPYSSVDDLSKAGVPARTIAKITPMVTATASAKKTASSSDSSMSAKKEAKAEKKSKASPMASSDTASHDQGTPGDGKVWVNLDSKVYHRAGDRWYGKTKSGKFMTEDEANKAGYREAKHEGKSKK